MPLDKYNYTCHENIKHSHGHISSLHFGRSVIVISIYSREVND